MREKKVGEDVRVEGVLVRVLNGKMVEAKHGRVVGSVWNL